MKKFIFLALLAIMMFQVPSAFAQAPVIFFTDLTSGPNAGGETVSGFSGAYVTIYGNNLGASQGASTITWNGLNCLRVVPATGSYTGWGMTYFSYQKIIVQLGSTCTPGTGNFVVTVSGVASVVETENTSGGGTQIPSQFTVRTTGAIHCVSLTGNDANSGAFPSSCWRTMTQGVQIANGDVTYVQNGVVQASGGGLGQSLTPTISGTNFTTTVMAIVAYPGATATIGSTSNDGIFLCSNDLAGACTVSNLQYWTFGGFVIRGGNSALGIAHNVNNIRVTGSDLSCPNGNGSTACVTSNAVPPATISGFYFYGNQVHDSGLSTAIKTYHNVYWSNNTNGIYHAWGIVHDGGGCRGILINPSNGAGQFDIHIHDNLVYNTKCDAINLNFVAPTATNSVEVYNNIINNGGAGPDPSDGIAAYGCIDINNTTSTPVLVYNNTMYNCGARKLGGSAGAVIFSAGSGPSQFRNNIVFELSGESYNVPNGRSCAQMFDTNSRNNLWFGVGAPPCTLTNDKNVDPQLVSPSTTDFHLASSSSPVNGAGILTGGLVYDFGGTVRANPPSMGVYEFAAASGPTGTVTGLGRVIINGKVVIN